MNDPSERFIFAAAFIGASIHLHSGYVNHDSFDWVISLYVCMRFVSCKECEKYERSYNSTNSDIKSDFHCIRALGGTRAARELREEI